MAKIIKRKLRRSIPWLLILAMIGFSVSGFVFNFDIQINKIAKSGWFSGYKVDVSLPQVEAQDTATTSVTVRNAPPQIDIAPAETPVSTSTSPVNVGDQIGFTITASDQELNDYYLLVCDRPGALAVNSNAPTCNGIGATTFCTSTSTTQSISANCLYTVQDPGDEVDEWYAYACDDHGSDAACSSVSQGGNPGVDDASSPFYVNHAPYNYTAVTTTVDDQDPDAFFTVKATVEDADVLGGVDELTLEVCSSNSWSTSTGCAAQTFCTGTSTSPDITCQFASSSPAVDGTYSYWAFVKDWHAMPATGGSETNTYTINNVAPTVGYATVTFNEGVDISLNMKGMPDTVVWATSTSVSDNNGCADISSATSTFYWSEVTGGGSCTEDTDDCYQIGAGSCTKSSCVGTTATYACTGSLKFHARPTDEGYATNGASATNWIAEIRAFDEELSGSATSSSGIGAVDVLATEALEVTQDTIVYGAITAGTNSGDYNATTTVQNFGNTPLDSGIHGTDMVKAPDQIEKWNQTYDVVNFTFPGTYTLATTSTILLALDIVRPTSTDYTIEDNVFWGIQIPSGRPSGDYYGQNTYTAAVDDTLGAAWN